MAETVLVASMQQGSCSRRNWFQAQSGYRDRYKCVYAQVLVWVLKDTERERILDKFIMPYIKLPFKFIHF